MVNLKNIKDIFKSMIMIYFFSMENYLIQEALPLIYTGTDLEIQHILKN